jgi:molybdopterin biosynthesis enzyme
MDARDVHEDEAGERLARAAAGDGVDMGAASGGHWPLIAARRGILDVRVGPLRQANAIDGICVYSLYSGQVVEAGETVARAKITPFVLARARLEEAEAQARAGGGLVAVRPFLPLRVGAVVQETLGERAMERFRSALGEKVRWFGSELIEPRFVPARAESIADALDGVVSAGAQVVTVGGTKAMDDLDPTFRALGRLGVAVERHGVPAHPGSLFWIARYRGAPILGMPSCGLFSQATVFDLVLPRILTGEPFGRAEMAELGHGGFLTREMAFRFPPYRGAAQARGEVE